MKRTKPSDGELPIQVDGRVRIIETNKISTEHYKEALSIGLAQMIHEGKIRLEHILSDKPGA